MPRPSRSQTPIHQRDPSDPVWKSVELAQRGRMVLDVARADLEAAEAHLGPFHETTLYFRAAWDEARRGWDRLRADYGGAALEAALAEPPLTTLALGDDARGGPLAVLVAIGGKTYRVQRIAGTASAPIQWRLTRLPPLNDGPYFACRLRDGSTQCDCAEWTYQVQGIAGRSTCKHLAALIALGWL